MAEQGPDKQVILEGSGAPEKIHPALQTIDPHELTVLQEKMRELRETGGFSSQEVSSEHGLRPDWGAEISPELETTSRKLNQVSVFNINRDSSGKIIGHYDLEKEKNLRTLLREHLKQLADANLVRVITPFVVEPSAGYDVWYNKKLVGAENIVAIESGPNPAREAERNRAIAAVQHVGVGVLNQWDILNQIPWEKLNQSALSVEGNLSQPPRGTKGRQLYAAAFWLYAKEAVAKTVRDSGSNFGEHYNPKDILDDNAVIFFHDTDIADPHAYAATELLTIPLLSEFGEDFASGQIALLGRGRNNQSLRGLSNTMANDELLPEMQNLGRTLNRIIWHLAGERWLRWGELKKSILATGMFVETTFNFQMASRTILEKKEVRAQIAAARKKEEIVERSTPPREWRMLYGIEEYYKKLASFAADIHSYPSEWTLPDIAEFNRRYGNKLVYHTVESESSEPMNARSPLVSTLAGRTTRLDFLLPPIDMLHTNGVVTFEDLEKIARVIPLPGK